MKMLLSQIDDCRRVAVQIGGVLPLRRDAALAVEGARGLQVRCESGRLWITEEGRLEDVVLEAGQSTTLLLQGRALVRALAESRVAVERGNVQPAFPEAARLLRRWCNLARLRGSPLY
jgi:hypothetical protein